MIHDDRSKTAESGADRQRAVQVNGEPLGVGAGTTVADLVRSIGQDPRAVAVELNGHIVPRDRYGFVSLQEGDKVEIVHFVQGG